MPLRSRTQKPQKYNDYKRYKPFLRLEFQNSCVYCEVREPELGGSQSFCADHYKPASKFPQLETIYTNLLYACRHCNQWKSDFWPSLGQKLAGMVVLNPFLHKIEKHLDKSELAWKGRTIRGRWNVDKFRLDSAARVRQRQDRLNIESTIATLEQFKIAAKSGLQLAQQKKNASASSRLQLEINSLTNQIDTLRRQISGPMD